jgi:hypothetical protein
MATKEGSCVMKSTEGILRMLTGTSRTQQFIGVSITVFGQCTPDLGNFEAKTISTGITTCLWVRRFENSDVQECATRANYGQLAGYLKLDLSVYTEPTTDLVSTSQKEDSSRAIAFREIPIGRRKIDLRFPGRLESASYSQDVWLDPLGVSCRRPFFEFNARKSVPSIPHRTIMDSKASNAHRCLFRESKSTMPSS